MPSKLILLLMLFYSNFNEASLSIRIAINECIENHHQSFKIKTTMVNYDREKNICHQYGITGIPTLLVFLNLELVGRHYGDMTIKGIETIIQNNVISGYKKHKPEEAAEEKSRMNS